MEVHHPQFTHHKKKWTGYLLEFFMLFLAVFLGFIAENIREHVVEKNKAKGLSVALISDLQKDSAQLTYLRNFRNTRVMEIDSFYNMFNQPFSQIDRVSFYRLARKIQGTQDFTPAIGTINELKTAGYLRTFLPKRLASYLSEYETIYLDCGEDQKIEFNGLYDRYHNALIKYFDASSFDSLFNYPQLISGEGIKAINPADLAELKKVISLIKYINSVFIRPNGQFDKLKNKEVEIMNYLQQKY